MLVDVVARFNLLVTTVRNLQAVFVFVIVLGGLAWVGMQLGPPVWVRVTGAFLLGILTGLAAAILTSRIRANKEPVDTGFAIKKYEILYAINDVDHRRHQIVRRLTLKATKNNASLYFLRYQWSGRGKLESPVVSQGHAIIGDLNDYSTMRCLIIYLGRSYSRGEEVSTEITQELHDEHGKFGHFIARITKEKLDAVTLSVRLPSGLSFKPAVRASIDVLNKQATWIQKQDLTGDVRSLQDAWTLTVLKPPIGANVMLKWSWEGVY